MGLSAQLLAQSAQIARTNAEADAAVRAQAGNLVGGWLMSIPEKRRAKQATSYWQNKDFNMNPAISIGDEGNLSLDESQLNRFQLGTMSDEWNKYQSHMKLKNVRVRPEDYQTFVEQYNLKATEYSNTMANKFSAMKMRGVQDSKLRDLVHSNPQFRDTLSRLGMVNPAADAQFAPYLQAKKGLLGGFKKTMPEALKTAGAWYGIPAAIAGYGAYKKTRPFMEGIKRASGLDIGRRFGEKMGKSKGILASVAKKWSGVTGKKLGSTGFYEGSSKSGARGALVKAQDKVKSLYTKTGKLKKSTNPAQLKKANTALKKAQTIFKKVPKGPKMSNTKMIQAVLQKKGIRGLTQMLTKAVGRKAAMGLMVRAGLGTILSGTGVGTAVGIGLNATAALQIGKALSKAFSEVEGDTVLQEKIFGKTTGSTALKGSQY